MVPSICEVVEAGEGELAAKASAGKVGVHCDHVYLAERLAVLVMELGPAKPGEAALELVEQEASGVEPRLRLAGFQRLFGPAALLRVPAKSPVVDL